MIIQLVSLNLVLAVIDAKFIQYVERCPTREERRFVKHHPSCSAGETYHCLKDDEFDLVETCNREIQLPKGNYPRYTGFSDRIFYEECPDNKYQPWPVKSYEIAECELDKSKCNGDGQIPCDVGSTTTDSTCSCDYRKGYVISGTSRCCSPSAIEDCFCQYRPCQNSAQELNSDYRCVDKCPPGYERLPNQNACSLIIRTTASMENITMVTITTDVTVTLLDERNSEGKILFLIFFFLIVIITVLAVYKIGSHEISKERITFTEEYDLLVFELLQAAAKGDIDKLKSLRDQRYIDLYETDYDNRSALHLAACEGQLEAVLFLLRHGAYSTAKDRCMQHTASEDAKWHQDRTTDTAKKQNFEKIIDKLSAHKSVPRRKTHFRDMIAIKLKNAAKNGDLSELERLHSLNTDMNLSDADGKTALHEAVENGQVECVKLLLQTCQVSLFGRFRGKRPIELVKDAEENISRMLKECELESRKDCIQPPESMKPKDELQVLRLLNYASRGDIKRMRGLKLAEYNMGLTDYDQRNALHVAVHDGQEHIVDFLLGECDLGPQPENKEDRWGQTPLSLAKERGKGHIFRIFLKHCPNVVDTESEEYKTFTLLMAGYKGDIETLKRLFKNGIDINIQDYDGRTALHLAAAENKHEAVKYLITECNCKKDIQDRNGNVAGDEIKDDNLKDSFPHMMFKPRLSFRRSDFIQSKEKRKATKGSSFNVLSHRKVSKSSDSTTSQKSKMQIKPAQITDRSNMYAMYEAAAIGDIEMLKACEYPYFERGDYIKNTPLHIAAINGHMDIVKYLVEECHVSLFIRNKAMEYALDSVKAHLGFMILRPATFFNIEQRKRLSDIRNYLERNMRAAENLKDTIKEDSSFSKYDDDVKTFMLLNKAFKGDIRAIRGYIQTDKTIINRCDYDKRTALHIVVAEKHTHLVKYFLQSDELKDFINPFEKDRWGKTPQDEAEENGFGDLVDLFKFWKQQFINN